MTTTKYVSVSLPVNLASRVEKVIDGKGYVSVAEFVKDSCRRRLEELEG